MTEIKSRIAAIENYVKGLQPAMTRFLLENETEFYTEEEPFTYLMSHGAYTPDGRRITAYPHPVKGIDELSLSLYQMLDEAIENGRLELPDLVSDEP